MGFFVSLYFAEMFSASCILQENLLLLPLLSDYATQNQMLFLKAMFQTHVINNVESCLTLRLCSQYASG